MPRLRSGIGASTPAEPTAVAALVDCVIKGDLERAKRWIHVADLHDYQAMFMFLVKKGSTIPRCKTLLERVSEERRQGHAAFNDGAVRP